MDKSTTGLRRRLTAGLTNGLTLGTPLLAVLFTLAGTAVSAAELPADFEAKLEVLRNDKVIGEAIFSLTTEDGRWVMSSRSKGTRGIAKFVGFEEQSESRGDWHDGGPRPLAFRQSYEATLVDRVTTADFDWEAGTVHSVHKDGEDHLTLQPGVLDSAALGLKIRAGLAAGQKEWTLAVVDEDEIETQIFRINGSELLQTPLGCLETVRVDRIRGPESSRYTRTWYARDLSWVPVRVAHGKTDGDQMETRLLSLQLDGEGVTDRGDCPTR